MQNGRIAFQKCDPAVCLWVLFLLFRLNRNEEAEAEVG